MSYVVSHHGALWFQIRVPTSLQSIHGKLVRVNLQTRDPGVARALALRLASDWLSRFQTDVALLPMEGLQAELVDVANIAPLPFGQSCSSQPALEPAQPIHSSSLSRPPARSPKPVSDKELLDAWLRIDPTRASTTTSDMRATLKAFRSRCRKPWPELERQDIANFRDYLLSTRLARATVSKKVGFISSLMQVGFDAGLLKQNVARGLKVPRAEMPTIERRAFTPQELKKIFDSPVFTKDFRPVAGCGAACAWMPMLGLVTGARLEEISQLLLHDIILDEEHGPLMRITDEGESQRVKTIGSKRIVPLHPEILQAGFLDYVETVRASGQRWLFPELLPDHDGRRGGNFGKWFQRYLRVRTGIGISDPRVVFHSFRHTFKTLCRAAEISEEVHDALTGHVSASVSRQYGEMPIGPLVRAIHAIKLPVALPHIGA
ncbi:Phage_integrase domain-containing protein [Thauera humireducens]|jgi:integrase|uniref:site-specific integrase n=1 Tax=Thauera humireducens TaxID=1134435 RepID=UPI002467A12C|nr:site-specific integrase [Thauera humireducens]CAH1748107.1 Phage_integrase domain-containing protein [Thauera humireducens]